MLRSHHAHALNGGMSAFMRILLSCIAVLLFTGCASKSYVVLLENPDGTTGQVIVKGKQGEQLIKTAREGAPLDGSATAKLIPEDTIKKDFADAMAARPKLPAKYMLYFEKEATLTAESEQELKKVFADASSRPTPDLSVIGHTDTAGNAEDNERLSLARARAVAGLLQSMGLKANSLKIESHGERNLLVKTPDNTTEPKNRRVEISIR